MDWAMNAMFLREVRPMTLNQRLVKLIHKGGKPKNKAASYRPITLQWIFGKQLDSIMNARLLAFGIRMKIITKHHFGFIRGVGTTDAVIYLMDLIAANKSAKAETHIVFFDYKGAFQTVIHAQMLEILADEYGINGHMLAYLKLCLENRWGRVEIGGYFSEWREDCIGAGQGWPPASTIYILVSIDIDVVNELSLAVRLVLYADDTTAASDERELALKRQACVEVITQMLEDANQASDSDAQQHTLWCSEFDDLRDMGGTIDGTANLAHMTALTHWTDPATPLVNVERDADGAGAHPRGLQADAVLRLLARRL